MQYCDIHVFKLGILIKSAPSTNFNSSHSSSGSQNFNLKLQNFFHTSVFVNSHCIISQLFLLISRDIFEEVWLELAWEEDQCGPCIAKWFYWNRDYSRT